MKRWLGVALLVVGLAGHLLAAHKGGGSTVAYQHHVIGFLLLTFVSGIIVAALGWVLWKGRHDVTLLIVGALQALMGLLIAATA